MLDKLIREDIQNRRYLGFEIEIIKNGYILNIYCSEPYKIYCFNKKKLNEIVKEAIDLFTKSKKK